MQLELENVRTFRGRHTIPITPITLIVGENSAGKTTLLSMLSAVWQADFPSSNSFRIPPFDLGSYDAIATYAGSRWRSHSFTIGYRDDLPRGGQTHVSATFRDSLGQPILSSLNADSEKGQISLQIDQDKLHAQLSLKEGKGTFKISMLISPEQASSSQSLFFLLSDQLFRSDREKDQGRDEIRRQSFEYHDLLTTFFRLGRNFKSPVSIAPVRTKPRRTYDELVEDFKPEGDHVPLIMARVWQSTNAARKKKLKDALVQFGNESGLFVDLEVKRLGKAPSSPFRIMVKVSGPPVNLPDVGYGVSQSLPLIVESVLAARGTRLILQQPEVHLHPKAQAALGTFFSELVAKDNKQFVIETHSDFLVDRVRQEVARRTLRPEAVSILFLDRRGGDTTATSLVLDEKGNITNAPPSYRQFFLQEELNLLSRGEGPRANDN